MTIRDVVFQQQKEKEDFLSKDYIEREGLDRARKAMGNNLIKVVSGPRRAGKSIFAFLLLRNRSFVYLNFDDDNLLKIKDSDELMVAVNEVCPKNKDLFFDEIQNLPNWEIFVNKLQRRGYRLLLTGSNARLLSGELASRLTGRYLNFTVLPFSFREFLIAKKFNYSQNLSITPEAQGQILFLLEEYLRSGGFPEVVVNNLNARSYLDTLFQAVLLKDVIKRYRLRSSSQLYDLSSYLANNFAVEMSYTRLKNLLSLKSAYTVQKYVHYLTETYFFFVLNRFSLKMKEQMKSPKKIYLVDNGLLNAETVSLSPNTGRFLENFVFVELLRREYQPNLTLFSYLSRSRSEVDFLSREGTIVKQLLQVCYHLSPENEKRETKALIEASEELSCQNLLILTWNQEDVKKIGGKTIQVVPIWQWLLNS